LRLVDDGGTTRWLAGLLGTAGARDYVIYDSVTPRQVIGISATSGVVSLSGTTASTSTTTGALVVSGGLGVGGAANIGGTLTVSGTGGIGASASGDVGFKVLSSLTSGSFQYGIYSYPTVNAGTADGGLFGVRAGTSVAVTTAFALRAFTPTLDSGASIASNIGIRVENQGATGITNAFGIDILAQSGASTTNVGLRNAGTTLLTNTTASTSTTTGALVVSGGVGVAGAINGGGLFDFAVSANSTQVYTIQNTSTGASASTRLTLVGGTSSGSIQLYGSGHSTPNILQYASPDTHKWQCNGVERASLSSAGVLTLAATTASTSTSSGALVVSGGVGVSGAIVSGGNIGIGNVNPVVAYTSTGSLLGSGDNPQVRLSSTGSSGWAFSTYANTAADGKWSAGLNAGANRYIITNDLDLSGTAALSILPTTLAATFGGALLATGTLTANAASNAFRITNSQTPASAAATGTAGTIAWDSSYIYVCTATNTWKRVAISTW
jgi:hypothetical protein